MFRKIIYFTIVLWLYVIHTESIIVVPLKNYDWKIFNLRDIISYQNPVTIPSGIYSDLKKTGILDDILYRDNEIKYRWVAMDIWVYSVNFSANELIADKLMKELIFHGLDGTSTIFLNGAEIGKTANTFVRYRFDVTNLLNEDNYLHIFFESPIQAVKKQSELFKRYISTYNINELCEKNVHLFRRMQASFGSDSAPTFPSIGIWKDVELVVYERDVIIRNVMTIVNRMEENWHLIIKVHCEVPINFQENIEGHIESVLTVKNENTITVTKEVNFSSDTKSECNILKMEMLVPLLDVELWWPNEYGSQPLYNLSVSFSNENILSNKKSVKIGFRTLELKEDLVNETGDEESLPGYSFYFVVNDVPIFAKGAAFYPVDILLENSSNKKKIKHLLYSAKLSHMNMIRVPAIGIYQPDYFYELCDQFGLLVWQEMMFYEEKLPLSDPDFLAAASISTEISQQIMRLQYHPSIAIWIGNDQMELNISELRMTLTENEYEVIVNEYGIFVEIFEDIISKLIEDTRPYLLSSPSNVLGPKLKDRLVSAKPNSLLYGTAHARFYKNNWLQPFYITLEPRFVTQYGIRSFPSLESYKEITEKDDLLSVNTRFMNYRQRGNSGNINQEIIDSIHFHFGTPKPEDLENLIYASQINQAWALKLKTEVLRKWKSFTISSEYGRHVGIYGRTMGALYWHLNDVWQSPTFSSIEYSGKWKMLHYYACKFFAPIISFIEVSNYVKIFLISDLILNKFINVKLEIYEWSSMDPIYSQTEEMVELKSLSSTEFSQIDVMKILVKECDEPLPVGKKCIIKLSLSDPHDKSIINTNVTLPPTVPFKEIDDLPKVNIRTSVDSCTDLRCNITVETNAIALFVWLDAKNISGYFSDNGFIMTESTMDIVFYSENRINKDELDAALTVKVMDKNRLESFMD